MRSAVGLGDRETWTGLGTAAHFGYRLRLLDDASRKPRLSRCPEPMTCPRGAVRLSELAVARGQVGGGVVAPVRWLARRVVPAVVLARNRSVRTANPLDPPVTSRTRTATDTAPPSAINVATERGVNGRKRFI